MEDDAFDDLFGLEDKYFDEGYQQGFHDGLQQSHTEARLFGIEKGYEKFIEMGRLQARVRAWMKQLDKAKSASENFESLKDVAAADRTAKHVELLLALVDPATLSMENSDEAVAEFDDRVKRAHAKCKVIAKLLDEPEAHDEPKTESIPSQKQDKIRKPNSKDVDF